MPFFSAGGITSSIRHVASDTVNSIAKPVKQVVTEIAKPISSVGNEIAKPISSVVKPIGHAASSIGGKALDFANNRINNVDDILNSSAKGLSFLGSSPILTIALVIGGAMILSSLVKR